MKQILQNARTGCLELPQPLGYSKATVAMLEAVRSGREARIEP